MNYLKLIWVHNCEYDPVIYYYESDEENTICRVIQIYCDGRTGLASKDVEFGGAHYPEGKMESIDFIKKQPDLFPFEFSKDKFEYLWKKELEKAIDK